jgi:hypothetical protein
MNLSRERERQLNTHLEHHLYEALSVSKDRYVDRFPEMIVPPDEIALMYKFPLIVTEINKLPLDVQMSLIGGVNLVEERIIQWGERPPKPPYVTWTNGGVSNRNKSVDEVRARLSRRSRASTVSEGILLALVHPEVVRGYGVDLPGSSVGTESVASLSWVNREPTLYDDWVDRQFPNFGSLVSSK